MPSIARQSSRVLLLPEFFTRFGIIVLEEFALRLLGINGVAVPGCSEVILPEELTFNFIVPEHMEERKKQIKNNGKKI